MIIRGLRAVADFEYEYPDGRHEPAAERQIETVFLMADVSLQPIASKLVKEIALFGGDISRFVSPAVRADVLERVEQARPPRRLLNSLRLVHCHDSEVHRTVIRRALFRENSMPMNRRRFAADVAWPCRRTGNSLGIPSWARTKRRPRLRLRR